MIYHQEDNNPMYLHGAVDSDRGDDTNHRRSVIGLRLAGGTVLYKTKEAEFSTACDR